MEFNKPNQQAKLERWQQQVYECRNSGMTIKAWCEAQGITLKSYSYHQEKVWQAAQQEKAMREMGPRLPQPVIIPYVSPIVSPQQESAAAPAFIIRNGAWTMEVNRGCDPELLQLALRAVK
jgi:hypothetical protein